MSSSNGEVPSYVGKTLGEKYAARRLIGSGGMGAVYEAEHLTTHRRVALKVLHPWLIESSAAIRFVREAQAPPSIGHPAIVDVLDAGKDADGTPYIAFELLEGMDLETALQKNGLQDIEIVWVAIEVLDALATAHAAGFVHRDVKPSNIFLARSPAGTTVKLLDFGVVKRIEATQITSCGITVGTLEYMSPEQAHAQKVDARTDLWAVGATIFRGLTGRPPFEGAGFRDLLLKLMEEVPPPLSTLRPDVPPALADVVDRALAIRPDDRWSSAVEMHARLAECVHTFFPETVHDLWMRGATVRVLRRDALTRASSSSAGGLVIASDRTVETTNSTRPTIPEQQVHLLETPAPHVDPAERAIPALSLLAAPPAAASSPVAPASAVPSSGRSRAAVPVTRRKTRSMRDDRLLQASVMFACGVILAGLVIAAVIRVSSKLESPVVIPAVISRSQASPSPVQPSSPGATSDQGGSISSGGLDPGIGRTAGAAGATKSASPGAPARPLRQSKRTPSKANKVLDEPIRSYH